MESFQPNFEVLELVHSLAIKRPTLLEWNSETGLPFRSSSGGVGNFQIPTSRKMPNHFQTNVSPPSLISSSNSKPRLIKSNAINSSPGRRIQPVSAPRKPPDIQNRAMFPPIETEPRTLSLENEYKSDFPELMTCMSRTIRTHREKSGSKTRPTDACFAATNAGKLKKLEDKFKGKEELKSSGSSAANKVETSSNTDISVKRLSLDSSKKRQNPRSADLFSEITPSVQAEIDQLAVDYSALLDKNLCQNVLEELTLLLQLISSNDQQQFDMQSQISGKLTTIAQQVYFVIKVLSLQLHSSLLSVDPIVIQILVEKYPHRIPKLVRKHFQSWVDTEISKWNEAIAEVSRKPSEFHHCVTFRSETDGRSNFPSQGDFHGFCKQRDLFYSIKGTWNERGSCNIPGESVQFGKSNSSNYPNKSFKNETVPREVDPIHGKIKALFKINSSWANLSHLAALFTSQYIIDSMEESRSYQSVELDELMKLLQNSNPDRFAKLNNRMSSISEVESKQNDKDSFAFLQFFLKIAASPAFNQHLLDRITYEINQVECSLDSAGSEVLSEGEETYLVKKCVLLAKLLGYIFFLPYREEANPTSSRLRNISLDKETVLSRHMELRKTHHPPLELKSMLISAVRANRLTLTLPWVVEFLSAADFISLQLPSYQDVLAVLCSLYRNVLTTEEKFTTSLTLSNKNFLRFWCGNFFSSEIFPVASLFKTSPSFEGILAEKGSFSSLISSTVVKNDTVDDQKQMKHDDCVVFDANGLIGERLTRFYFSSNFNQMKYVLHVGLQQQNDLPAQSQNGTVGSVRHIRPIPAMSSVKTIPGSSETELQKQLESSFFDGNSPSVKKTVDFISDRIASNYVKRLRKMMPEQRNNMTLKRLFGEAAASNCRAIMLQGVTGFIEEQCEVSVNILIGESLSTAALEICYKITKRQTSDKICQWIHSHIKEDMFPEVPVPETSEPTKSSPTPPISQENNAAVEEPLSFSSMILLHRCHKKLHDRKQVSADQIDDILNSTVLGKITGMANTLLDFGIALITFAPSILDRERQIKLVHLWRPQWTEDHHLISPRNIKILQEGSANSAQSWERLEEVILRLIDQRLLDFKGVEQDCFRLLREDLTPEESKNLSQLLRKIVSATQQSDCEDMSREVVDWISWYCSEDNGEF